MIQSYTPTIIPRWYQAESIDKGSRYLMSPRYSGGGLIVLPTGCHAKGTGVLMRDGSIKKVA